ncbi:MAG: endoribonuclease MazF [Candidatus Solibacter usitatus]|nr:endoribonuclease MazF [Candidatus Solibacter usitatus]
MVKPHVPDRGDVVWLDWDPQAGHEQGGHRPALVLSPRSYNGLVGLALFCPLTSQEKGYPFEVPLPAGSKARGAVLADQIKSFDWRARSAHLMTRLPEDLVEEVLVKLSLLLRP